MGKILAVDCDEVLTRMRPQWLKWCNDVTGKNLTERDVLFDYNLCRFFPEIDAMLFWSQNLLYSTAKPTEGSVEVLSRLKTDGWEIGVVSYCKKDHFASKHDFLKHYYPFLDFIITTKEKGYASRADIFIDDRNKYLNQQPESVKLIKMQTPYTQDEELKKITLVVSSWKEIYNYLKKEGE